MGDYFLGEIRIFAFPQGNVPSGWVQCNGQQIQIQQNTALYSLLGTQFGGDARTVFNIPDLRGRAIVGAYNGGPLPTNVVTRYAQGNAGMAGTESVGLTSATAPPHIHSVYGSSAAGEGTQPQSGVCANVVGSTASYTPVANPAGATTPQVALDPAGIAAVGGGNAHSNMQPFITLNFCIAVSGTYPYRP